jgi:hypothetical protein
MAIFNSYVKLPEDKPHRIFQWMALKVFFLITLRDPMAGEHHLDVGHRRWSSSHQVAAQENGTGLAGVLMVSSPKKW